MKRKLLSATLALVLCMSLFPAAAAAGAERGVIRFEQIIAPQYEDAGRFFEGLAPVKQGGKWGYINEANEVVVDFAYDWANSFSEGYAIVGKYASVSYERYDDEAEKIVRDTLEVAYLGRIDSSGNYKPLRNTQYYLETNTYAVGTMTVYRDWFDYSRSPHYYNGWVSIWVSAEDQRVFDINGEQFKTADDERYQAVSVPAEGLVCAIDHDNGSVVYLDMAGNVAIEFDYTLYDAAWQVVADPDGEDWDRVRYGKQITDGFSFNQGLALVAEYTYDYDTQEESYLLGFIDRRGNWAIKPQFDYYWVANITGECKAFNSAGLAALGKDGKRGAINKAGETVISFIYDDLQVFHEGLAAFKQGELYGYIDVDGNVAIPAIYEAASGFSEGIAVAYDGARAFLIDRKGNKIPGADAIDPSNYFGTYSDGDVWVHPLSGKYVTIRGDGKFGFGTISYTPPLPEPQEMDSWAYREVIEAVEAGLVPVELQNMYRHNITRSEYSLLVVTSICAMLRKDIYDFVQEVSGKELDAWMQANPFSDTADGNIIAAYALGLVTGYDDGTFKPYDRISRQEAAVLLWRAAGLLGMENSKADASDFTDRGSVAEWAVMQVDYVSYLGVMNGTGEGMFSPAGFYTRQQSYMTVWRLFEAMQV